MINLADKINNVHVQNKLNTLARSHPLKDFRDEFFLRTINANVKHKGKRPCKAQ